MSVVVDFSSDFFSSSLGFKLSVSADFSSDFSSGFELWVSTAFSTDFTASSSGLFLRAIFSSFFCLDNFSASKAFLAASAFNFSMDDVLSDINLLFSSSQFSNFFKASSSLCAPFFTPSIKCFFIKTPV